MQKIIIINFVSSNSVVRMIIFYVSILNIDLKSFYSIFSTAKNGLDLFQNCQTFKLVLFHVVRSGYFASKQCVLCWSLRIFTSYVHSVHNTFCKSNKSYCYFIPLSKRCFKLSKAGVKTCHARNQHQTCGCPAPSNLQFNYNRC